MNEISAVMGNLQRRLRENNVAQKKKKSTKK